MKFKITMAEVIEATWQTVNGTCRSSDIVSSLPDGIYELLAKAYNKETNTFMEYDSSKVEALSIYLGTLFEDKDFEDQFWDAMGGSGRDLCRACGWWDEDVVNSPDDYIDPPISEGCMCSDCAEELETR